MGKMEERFAIQKAKEMDPDELRAFLKGVPRDIFIEEVARRMMFAEQINEMDATIKRLKGLAS